MPVITGGAEMDAQFYLGRRQKGVPDFGKGTERDDDSIGGTEIDDR